MKERPILFSGEMVQAILDGRKTQTRRILKQRKQDVETSSYELMNSYEDNSYWAACWGSDETPNGEETYFRCPYGRIGDRLWVREAWMEFPNPKGLNTSGEPCMYRATSSPNALWKWKPSIHMPRWASRITIEITGVRVERLNDISEQDAIAEGLTSNAKLTDDGKDYTGFYASDNFLNLWCKIYGDGSFDANPWVWVVEFVTIKDGAKC